MGVGALAPTFKPPHPQTCHSERSEESAFSRHSPARRSLSGGGPLTTRHCSFIGRKGRPPGSRSGL
jgi:hypothetical protein